MNNNNSQIIQSLSGDDERLLEFIPYILQDLYSLGTDRELLIEIVNKNLEPLSNVNTILNLCCGKGASIITLCQKFGWSGKGIDLFTPFIEDARKHAEDNHLQERISFEVIDIADAISNYRNYDIVLYGSDVSSLGSEEDALLKIKKCLSVDGYIVYETAYPIDIDLDLRINNAGFIIKDKIIRAPESVKVNNDFNTSNIEKRICELIKQFPDHKKMLKKYLKSQKDECLILENNFKHVTYLMN